jgi:hypothetical protein
MSAADRISDEEIIELLRERARVGTAVEVAELLGALSPDGLTQGAIVMFFSRAFAIPIRQLISAGDWHRVSTVGTRSDDGFNDLLEPWLEQWRNDHKSDP